MPDDLKNFYMTNNGFTLTWSVKMNGNGKSYYFILVSVNYVVDIVFSKAQLVDLLMDCEWSFTTNTIQNTFCHDILNAIKRAF